jgi:hypothetical protein
MGQPESQTAYLRRTAILGALDAPDVFHRSFRLFTKEVMPQVGADIMRYTSTSPTPEALTGADVQLPRSGADLIRGSPV